MVGASLVVGLMVATSMLAGSNVSELNRFSWSETAGWQSWRTANEGVVIHGTHLSGFVWSENVGWIRLGADSGGPYANTDSDNWGVNRDAGGALSGFAWSENVGWLRFSTDFGDVEIDEDGALAGYVWSENLGWIHLSNDGVGYGVALVLPAPPAELVADRQAQQWSNEPIVHFEWSGAEGNGAGLGYSTVVDQSPTTEPDNEVEIEHEADPVVATSGELPDGAEHYFHLKSCDLVGNCSAALHLGPFWIDTVPPMIETVSSVLAPEFGEYESGDATRASITQVLARFSEPMLDPGGDNDPEDVTNPDNYLVVGAGSDGLIQTESCEAGLHPDDVLHEIEQILYVDELELAATSFTEGRALPRGLYRFIFCGSTSLVDRAHNALDGAGGLSGSDAATDVEVLIDNLVVNPNFDASLDGWIVELPAVGDIVHRADVDVDGAPTSGALTVFSSAASGELFKVSQCVDLVVEDDHGVGVFHAVMSPSASAPTITMSAAVFEEAGCLGSSLTPQTIAVAAGDTGGTWSDSLSGGLDVPSEASSIRLDISVDAGEADTFEVFIDGVSFFAGAVFADGLEDGTTDVWSAVEP